MFILFVIVVLILLLGGGIGWRSGNTGLAWGGGGLLGLVLVIFLLLWLFGGLGGGVSVPVR
jgi:hypothetical protein